MRLLFAVLLLLWTAPAWAQEVAVPDAPVPATITGYKIASITMQSEPEYRMRIAYIDSNGKQYTDDHFGPEKILDAKGLPVDNPESAIPLMRAINVANNAGANPSMTKKMYQHLVQHGKIPPSTVTGTPGPPPPK